MTAARLAVPPLYPESHLTSLANVYNDKARAFYQRYGVQLIHQNEVLTLKFDCKPCEMHIIGKMKGHILNPAAPPAWSAISARKTWSTPANANRAASTDRSPVRGVRTGNCPAVASPYRGVDSGGAGGSFRRG